MNGFANEIVNNKPENGKVDLYWLGGTSFIIRSLSILLGLDLYLSNACMQKDGSFKRLIPAPLKPEDINLDYLIAIHDHGDHFDTESLERFINPDTGSKLIGPASVMKAANKLDISSGSLIELNRGQKIDLEGMSINAVFSDHGEYAPDCIGVIIGIGGKRIYFTSDTCYRPDLPELIDLEGKIDLLLVPINGKWGNPDPEGASSITAWVQPDKVIPSHFWLFAEHGGDPEAFAEHCKVMAPESKIVIPAIGEKIKI